MSKKTNGQTNKNNSDAKRICNIFANVYFTIEMGNLPHTLHVCPNMEKPPKQSSPTQKQPFNQKGSTAVLNWYVPFVISKIPLHSPVKNVSEREQKENIFAKKSNTPNNVKAFVNTEKNTK